MTRIICQTLFHQNFEIENSPNFKDVKVSQYTVYSFAHNSTQMQLEFTV